VPEPAAYAVPDPREDNALLDIAGWSKEIAAHSETWVGNLSDDT
jgi:hypothetical protein